MQQLRRASFDTTMRLEDFEWAINPKTPKAKIGDLGSCNFIDKHESVLLIGPNGFCKSRLAHLIGERACGAGDSIALASAHRMLSTLRVSRADQSHEKKRLRFTTPDLPVVDDLGLHPLEGEEPIDVYEIVSQRYERGSIISTCSRAIKEWYPLVLDLLMASAAMDRLLPHASIVVIEGHSDLDPPGGGKAGSARRSSARKGLIGAWSPASWIRNAPLLVRTERVRVYGRTLIRSGTWWRLSLWHGGIRVVAPRDSAELTARVSPRSVGSLGAGVPMCTVPSPPRARGGESRSPNSSTRELAEPGMRSRKQTTWRASKAQAPISARAREERQPRGRVLGCLTPSIVDCCPSCKAALVAAIHTVDPASTQPLEDFISVIGRTMTDGRPCELQVSEYNTTERAHPAGRNYVLSAGVGAAVLGAAALWLMLDSTTTPRADEAALAPVADDVRESDLVALAPAPVADVVTSPSIPAALVNRVAAPSAEPVPGRTVLPPQHPPGFFPDASGGTLYLDVPVGDFVRLLVERTVVAAPKRDLIYDESKLGRNQQPLLDHDAANARQYITTRPAQPEDLWGSGNTITNIDSDKIVRDGLKQIHAEGPSASFGDQMIGAIVVNLLADTRDPYLSELVAGRSFVFWSHNSMEDELGGQRFSCVIQLQDAIQDLNAFDPERPPTAARVHHSIQDILACIKNLAAGIATWAPSSSFMNDEVMDDASIMTELSMESVLFRNTGERSIRYSTLLDTEVKTEWVGVFTGLPPDAPAPMDTITSNPLGYWPLRKAKTVLMPLLDFIFAPDLAAVPTISTGQQR